MTKNISKTWCSFSTTTFSILFKFILLHTLRKYSGLFSFFFCCRSSECFFLTIHKLRSQRKEIWNNIFHFTFISVIYCSVNGIFCVEVKSNIANEMFWRVILWTLLTFCYFFMLYRTWLLICISLWQLLFLELLTDVFFLFQNLTHKQKCRLWRLQFEWGLSIIGKFLKNANVL